MTGTPDDEFQRLLLRRRAVLRAVVDGVDDKRDLVERLEIPRSTLDDVMRELAEAGLVSYDDGRWRPTSVGRTAQAIHADYTERVSGVADAASVLGAVPDIDIGQAMLDGCTVHEPGNILPDRAVTTFTEQVRTADELRGLVPRALTGHVPSVHDEILEDRSMRVELVFEPAVFDQLADVYATKMAAALETDRIGLYRTSLPHRYGLWICDGTHAGVIIYGDGGIRGIITNDTDSAVDWATTRYRQARGEAEPIPLATVESS
jgi:predicted transcriptional regulator